MPRPASSKPRTLSEATTAAGKRGEDRAAAYLRSIGYHIIERNVRCRAGELDIVARDGETLVFVEVRTRANGRHGLASETVTRAKQQRIAQVASYYLSTRRPRFRTCRFDVLGITGDELQLIKDAFRLGL